MNYLQIISEVTGVSIDNIMSTSRKGEITQARHLCMYFYKKEKKLAEIGRILNRKHPTVIHACSVISGLLDINDKQIKILVNQIEKKIKYNNMKEFMSIGSNQIAVTTPDKSEFIVKSEIVINTMEPAYKLINTDNEKLGIAKIPNVETFRFFATSNELAIIRDKISEELAVHEKLCLENKQS